MILSSKLRPYICKYLKNLDSNTRILQIQARCTFLQSFSSHMVSSDIVANNSLKAREIEIQIPYGKIAAKAWGSEKNFPVLAFHGWLDNCGTFDKLIPLLSDKYYYVTIDAPGHGRSSHQPPGTLYSDINTIIDFKRVADHFNWEKFHILGHSLGGQFGLLFAAMFPNIVHKVIVLDIVKPYSASDDLVADIQINGVSQVIKINNKTNRPAPVYNYEAAVLRLIKGMQNEISEEGARILLQRGAQESNCGKGLIFSRDLRFKPVEHISVRSHNTVEQFMSKLECELLVILAKDTSPYYQPEEPEVLERFIDYYKRTLKHFVLEHVEGNHFVHLNNPEVISPIINNFLLHNFNE